MFIMFHNIFLKTYFIKFYFSLYVTVEFMNTKRISLSQDILSIIDGTNSKVQYI